MRIHVKKLENGYIIHIHKGIFDTKTYVAETLDRVKEIITKELDYLK
jgi:hypothetical protein